MLFTENFLSSPFGRIVRRVIVGGLAGGVGTMAAIAPFSGHTGDLKIYSVSLVGGFVAGFFLGVDKAWRELVG